MPVTLELGGKCPAIVAEDSIDRETIKQLLGTKAVKNGQMCISVDYCLVPRERLEEFARLAAEHVREEMPGYSSSESCTGIISERHLERLQRLLHQAHEQGGDVRALEPQGRPDPATRQMPLSLVIDPPDDLALMREEIFGPILPVKPYDHLDEAIGRVNAAANARSRSTPSHTTRLPQRTYYGAPPQEAHASTPPPSTERCPRSRSVASGTAASDATTGSKDSASSPISAACSSAAKAIS